LLFQGLCEDFRHSNVLDYIFVWSDFFYTIELACMDFSWAFYSMWYENHSWSLKSRDMTGWELLISPLVVYSVIWIFSRRQTVIFLTSAQGNVRCFRERTQYTHKSPS
jgi:hypothetical protein